MLILSSLSLAFAMITRYAGTTLLIPLLLVLIMFSSNSARIKLRDCFILLFLGLAPLAIWLFRGYLIAGSVGGRRLAFHPIPASKLGKLVNTIYIYWFPISFPFWLKTIVTMLAFLMLICAFLVVCKAYTKKTEHISVKVVAMQSLILTSTFIYIAFTLISMLFLDASMTFDYRILSPLYAMSVILVVILCWSIIRIGNIPEIGWILAIVLFMLISLNVKNTIIEVDVLRGDGRGYSSRKWRRSETIAYARTLPKGIRIYSNGWDVISFFADKEAKMLPAKVSASTLQPNPDFDKRMNTVLADVLENNALIIYFSRKSFTVGPSD